MVVRTQLSAVVVARAAVCSRHGAADLLSIALPTEWMATATVSVIRTELALRFAVTWDHQDLWSGPEDFRLRSRLAAVPFAQVRPRRLAPAPFDVIGRFGISCVPETAAYQVQTEVR